MAKRARETGMGVAAMAAGERRLAYAPEPARDLRLLQLPGPLAESLSVGDCVHIVGTPGQPAVLCTDSKTFNMVRAETSNTLLLVCPEAGEGGDSALVAGVCDFQYELEEAMPRAGLVALRRVLAEHELGAAAFAGSGAGAGAAMPSTPGRPSTPGGPSGTPGGGPSTPGGPSPPAAAAKPGPTFDDLRGCVGASAAELRAALRRMGALCLEGRYHSLSARFRREVLEAALLAVAEHGWPLSAVPLAEAEAALADTAPGVVVRHVLETLRSYDDSDDEETAVALDPRAVAAAGTELLFAGKPSGFVWPEDDFRERWATSMPDTSEPDEAALRGRVLQDGAGLRWLDAALLSPLPAERMRVLFDVKARWTLEELEPYIEGLEGPDLKQADVLMKHARYVEDPRTGTAAYCRR